MGIRGMWTPQGEIENLRRRLDTETGHPDDCICCPECHPELFEGK